MTMATKMTQNGVSTTTGLGQEQYEKYSYGIGKHKKWAYQYDYRHTNGNLFSCCAPTLEEARRRRDKWLETQ